MKTIVNVIRFLVQIFPMFLELLESEKKRKREKKVKNKVSDFENVE